MNVTGLTIKDLIQELLEIQAEHGDDLPVYLEVIDQESYDTEQSEPDGEYTETIDGSGTLYQVVVPEGFNWEDGKRVSTGHYLCLRAVDDGDEEDVDSSAIYQMR